MGTPEFAVPTLERLHKEFGIKAVVTVEDKAQGRGRKQKPSPVKKKAKEFGIRVLQPHSLKDEDFLEDMKALQPDIICVIAFKILPESIYSLAKIASFNIHASLLPKYRGAAPINWAIINGDKKTGVSTFLLKKKVDTGDLLATREMEIPENATAGELHDLLMSEAAEIAVSTTRDLLEGSYSPIAQTDDEATPAPKIFREDCRIDFSRSAEEVKNFIHGMSPSPGAWTKLASGKTLKILRASLNDKYVEEANYAIMDGEFIIGCKGGSLSIRQLQLEGRQAASANDFIRGWRADTKGKFEKTQ